MTDKPNAILAGAFLSGVQAWLDAQEEERRIEAVMEKTRRRVELLSAALEAGLRSIVEADDVDVDLSDRAGGRGVSGVSDVVRAEGGGDVRRGADAP